MKPGENKIYNELVRVPGLTFTELKDKTNLSAPVLSEYLKKMQKLGVVVKELETKRYRLAQIYFPMKTLPNDLQKAYKIFAVTILRTALKISKIEEKEAKEEAFRKFLGNSFHYFMVINWKVIGEAIGVFAGKEKNIKDQDLIVEMNAIINRAFQDWAAPIANTLATAMLYNLDLVETGDQFFNEILKETTKRFDKLIQDVDL